MRAVRCSSEVKRPQREADYSLLSTAKGKTAWRFTSSSALVFVLDIINSTEILMSRGDTGLGTVMRVNSGQTLLPKRRH